jgi:transcription elongation GreA/GreB family factor
MTEQDVRRLHAVSDLYEDVNAESAARLRRALSRVTVTLASKIPRTTVTMNSRVICRDSSEQEHELTLVYPWDARGNRISVLSPRGRALLGASIGATLDVGERALTVVSIPYQPEAAGDHHL